MNTKKVIPFLFSVLAIASIVVLGNTQTVHAGSPPITSCTITPAMVSVQLSPNEFIQIPKTIDCDEEISGFNIASSTCQLNGVGFLGPALNFNSISFTEQITNLGNTAEEHCNAVYLILDTQGGQILVTQEIWINEVSVGGEFLQIENTALIIAGLQSSAIWILPVIAGVAGAGTLYIKTRMNRD